LTVSAYLIPLHSLPPRRSSDLALPDGAGPREPGDRRCAVRLRRKRREAHLLPAHEAGPAARGRREPTGHGGAALSGVGGPDVSTDRKSTRLNSSHVKISYAVFC